jgi:hypothetical protein
VEHLVEDELEAVRRALGDQAHRSEAFWKPGTVTHRSLTAKIAKNAKNIAKTIAGETPALQRPERWRGGWNLLVVQPGSKGRWDWCDE